MIEIYTESLLEAQQRMGQKAEVGDVVVRSRELTVTLGRIQIAVILPSIIGFYGATNREINEQVRELEDVYGEKLKATGAVWGPPMVIRRNGGRYEPALTVYSGTTEEQEAQIRDIVGFEITLIPLHNPSPR